MEIPDGSQSGRPSGTRPDPAQPSTTAVCGPPGNTASARQLGLETTGHASRGLAGPPGVSPCNLTLSPGEKDLSGLMGDASKGVLVTSVDQEGPAYKAGLRAGDLLLSINNEPLTVRFVVTIIIDAGTRISDRSTPCVPGKALVAVGRGRFWNATWIIRGHRTGIRAAVLILAGGYHIIALAASHREDHGKDRDHQRIPEETRLSGCVHGRPKVS